MAVHIRLARSGAKKAPFYRLVVTDQRSPRGGRFLEQIGTYNPSDNASLVIDSERYGYWTGVGAKPSDTVAGLVKAAKVAK